MGIGEGMIDAHSENEIYTHHSVDTMPDLSIYNGAFKYTSARGTPILHFIKLILKLNRGPLQGGIFFARCVFGGETAFPRRPLPHRLMRVMVWIQPHALSCMYAYLPPK